MEFQNVRSRRGYVPLFSTASGILIVNLRGR